MAATIADSAIPGARAGAAESDGRKACIFCALTDDSLLARDKLVIGAAGLEAHGNRAGDFRWRIHDGDAGRFERLPFGSVAAGVSGNDCAGMAHFLAERGGRPGNESNDRLGPFLCVSGRVLLHPATDLADEPDRVGSAVLVERLERIARRRAEHGVTANSDEGRLAKTGARQVETDQCAKAAAARDHSDTPGFEYA